MQMSSVVSWISIRMPKISIRHCSQADAPTLVTDLAQGFCASFLCLPDWQTFYRRPALHPEAGERSHSLYIYKSLSHISPPRGLPSCLLHLDHWTPAEACSADPKSRGNTAHAPGPIPGSPHQR